MSDSILNNDCRYALGMGERQPSSPGLSQLRMFVHFHHELAFSEIYQRPALPGCGCYLASPR